MKKLLILLSFFTVYPAYSQEVNDIEREFTAIYKEYCKKIHHKIKYGECFDTVVTIHLNYLTNHEENMITHHQLDVPKYRTVGDRIFSLFPYHTGDYAEIAIMGNIIGDKTAKQEAQEFFDSFMKSPGHRKIMVNKKFKYYAFNFKYNIHGWLVGVGVYSEIWGYK